MNTTFLNAILQRSKKQFTSETVSQALDKAIRNESRTSEPKRAAERSEALSESERSERLKHKPTINKKGL